MPLIELSDAVEVVDGYKRRNPDSWSLCNSIRCDIGELPTISADDVRGVGVWSEDRMDYRCSVCGKSVKDEIFYMFEPYQMPPYCPNCGARMEVSGDA